MAVACAPSLHLRLRRRNGGGTHASAPRVAPREPGSRRRRPATAAHLMWLKMMAVAATRVVNGSLLSTATQATRTITTTGACGIMRSCAKFFVRVQCVAWHGVVWSGPQVVVGALWFVGVVACRTGQTQWEPPIQPRHTSSSAATENRSEGVRAPVAAPNTVDPVPQPQLPPAVVDTLRSLMFRMSRMHQELDSMKDELAGVVSLLQVQFGGTGSQGHK